MSADAARRMWALLEPLHDVVYFSPESPAAAKRIGLKGFWMGYFAIRAAPLGAVTAAPVTALFFGFPAAQVERALPDAWTYATPADALSARAAACASSLRRLCGDRLVDVDEAAELAWIAAQECDDPGRALGAANRTLPRPDDSVEALWQATTTLREHRGDGHVAALVACGVGPVEAHLLKHASTPGADLDQLRAARRYPDDEWALAGNRLRSDGLLDGTGALTERGSAAVAEVERRTDLAAARPWDVLGADTTERLAALLTPLADAVVAGGELPAGNPVGLPSR